MPSGSNANEGFNSAATAVDTDNSLIRSGTEKAPQDIATLCLQAMNEQDYDVSALPNLARPEIDAFGQLERQAFDFDFADHHFKDAALQLDTLRLAEHVHGNLHAHAHIHGDAQEVHMKKRALDRVNLIFLHDGGMLSVLGLHGENGVVPRGRAQDR